MNHHHRRRPRRARGLVPVVLIPLWALSISIMLVVSIPFL